MKSEITPADNLMDLRVQYDSMPFINFLRLNHSNLKSPYFPYKELGDVIIQIDSLRANNKLTDEDVKLITDFFEILKQSQDKEANLSDFIKSRLQDKNTALNDPFSLISLILRKIAYIIDKEKANSIVMPLVQKENTYGTELNSLLPPQFIIADDGKTFIELVEFFKTALMRIKSGEEDIFQYIDSESRIKKLSENEKKNIAKYIPFANEFFEVAGKIKQDTKGTVLGMLQDLRKGLLAGDVSHGGSELDAGSAANIAIVAFKEKFEKLPQPLQDRLRKLRDKQKEKVNKGQSLGEIIDAIFKAERDADSNAIRYCIEILGRELEGIIDTNAEELRKISSNPDLLHAIDLAKKIEATISYPLNCFLLSKQFDGVYFLIDECSSFINKRDQEVDDPLFVAITNEAPVELVELLIKSGANIELDHIHFAIGVNRLDIVELILKHKPDFLELPDEFGQTPLHFAAAKGRDQIAEYLISQGANVNVQTGTQKTGTSPLDHAVKFNHVNVVKVLIGAGADIDPKIFIEATKNNQLDIVKLLFEHKHDLLESTDGLDQTPLVWAASKGFTKVVEYFISMGANLNSLSARDHMQEDPKTYRSPLEWALWRNHSEVIETLTKAGAEIHPRFLNRAARDGRLDIIQFVLNHKPEFLALADPLGQTALMCAAARGHTKVVEYLINHDGIDVTVKSKKGDSALDWAIKGKHPEIIRILLEKDLPYQPSSINEASALSNPLLFIMQVTGKNVLPAVYAANVNRADADMHLQNLYKVAKYLADQLFRLPDTSSKYRSLLEKQRELPNCTTPESLTKHLQGIHNIVSDHEDKGIKGVTKFTWLRKSSSHKSFNETFREEKKQFKKS